MRPEPPVVLLMGPTASGKSRLALELASHCAVEIISVDSAQVYRGMDIGTAKPTDRERAQVPHHLLDILDPVESYSAARFAADAQRLVGEIRARGRIPLLVGGTMLYFRAFDEGLSALPPADAALRRRLEREAAERGWPALHARLAKADPATAARLHPNDQQRVQRALEILETTGVAPSALRAHPRQGGGIEGLVVRVALEPAERAVLHRRIDARFEAMMAQGFLDEVRRLYVRGDLHAELPSIRAVGYRQLWAHLQGECGLAEAVARGKAASRQYAKRQLTWLRADSRLLRIDPDAPDAIGRLREAAGLAAGTA